MPDDHPFHQDPEEPPESLPILAPAEPGYVFVDEPLPPHPGFWWAVLWCLGILLVTQVFPGIVGIVIFLFRTGGRMTPEQMKNPEALVKSPDYIQAMLPAMILSQLTSVILAVLVIRLIVGRDWQRVLALCWPSWSHLLLVLMGLPGLMVVAVGIDGLAKKVLPSFFDLEQAMGMFAQWPPAVGVLIIGLGPGIGEELWFRGFFGRGLVSRYGIVAGILLTSLLFGLVHIEPRQAAYALVIGVLLHLAYMATRSLLVPIILHICNNSLSILAMHVTALQDIDTPPEQVPWYVYGSAVLLVAAVGWALYRTRALLVEDLDSVAVPWRPAFASVEYPPPETTTRVLRRIPSMATWALATAGLAVFVAALVLG